MTPAHNLRSEKDVEEILKLAVAKEGETEADLRQRLNAAASELGISPEALAEAEQEYAHRKAQAEAEEREKQTQRTDLMRSLALPSGLLLGFGLMFFVFSRAGFSGFAPMFGLMVVFTILKVRRRLMRETDS